MMKKMLMLMLAACAAVVGQAATLCSYGPYTPGEKVSESIPALVGYTAKGLPSGLKLKPDKATGVGVLTGTPKKAGTFTVTLKATAKSGAVETVTVQVVVPEQS